MIIIKERHQKYVTSRSNRNNTTEKLGRTNRTEIVSFISWTDYILQKKIDPECAFSNRKLERYMQFSGL